MFAPALAQPKSPVARRLLRVGHRYAIAQTTEHAQSLFDPEKIDLATQDPSGGANLYVVQDQPWIDSEAEFESLERKLRTCATFALEGQMHEMYPELRGQSWKIILDT